MLLSDLDTAIHGLTGRVAVIDELMRMIANDLIYVVVIAAGVLWFHRAGIRALAAIAIGALLALALGQLLGSVLHEPRPFVLDHFVPLVTHAPDGSFPSDHLLVMGAVVGGSVMASRRLAALLAIAALLVAVARGYVGIHHPVDVVAGFVIGAACGLAIRMALAPLQRRVDVLDEHLRRLHLRRGLGAPAASPRWR